MDWRRRSASTDCAVAIAIAALAAKELSTCSSSAVNCRAVLHAVEGHDHARAPGRGSRAAATSADCRAAASGSSRAPTRPARSRDALGAPRGQRREPPCLDGGSTVPIVSGAVSRRRRRDHQLAALVEQHERASGVDERAAALDDQLQHPLEVGLDADRAGDRGGRLEPAHSPLELLAPPFDPVVEAGVVDRDRRPLGQHDDRLLVGSSNSARPPCRSGRGCRTPPRGSRSARRGRCVIGGCPGGNPYERGCWVTSGSRSGSGSRISSPSTPRPRGSGPIVAARLLVDPHDRGSARAPPCRSSRIPERGVRGAGELPGGLEHLLEHASRGRARRPAHGRPRAAGSSSRSPSRMGVETWSVTGRRSVHARDQCSAEGGPRDQRGARAERRRRCHVHGRLAGHGLGRRASARRSIS